jgi:hypothetical protein
LSFVNVTKNGATTGEFRMRSIALFPEPEKETFLEGLNSGDLVSEGENSKDNLRYFSRSVDSEKQVGLSQNLSP